MADIVDFDGHRVAPYVIDAIAGFISDPPDSDYQEGYLAACLAIYREGIGRGQNDARVIKAEDILAHAAVLRERR